MKKREETRLALVGAALHAGVVGFLLGSLLSVEKLSASAPSCYVHSATGSGTQHQSTKPGVSLVRELLRKQTHTGREIRRLGPVDHPSLWPRDSLSPQWWRWRKVFASAWQFEGEHINVLEVRAVLAAILWRLRTASNIHTRCIQGMDSFVALGALAKGRSASRRLEPVISRINAVLLGASFGPVWGYFRTDLNPADAPSREQHQ